MKKEQIESLVRHVLTGVGAYLVGKGITNDAVVADVIGTILMLIGFGWSIAKKEFAINQLEGTLRQLGTTLGLFIAAITPNVVIEVSAFASTLAAIILGQTSKVKTPAEGAENK